MVNLKKLFSPPAHTQANPYSNPFNPNHPLRLEPQNQKQQRRQKPAKPPPRPPTASTNNSESTPQQNDSGSPRGSIDLLAEARRVVGRDPVTGRPAGSTPPLAPNANSTSTSTVRPGEKPQRGMKAIWDEGKRLKEQEKEQKSKSRLWGRSWGTKKDKQKETGKTGSSTPASNSTPETSSARNSSGNIATGANDHAVEESNGNIGAADKGKGKGKGKQAATEITAAPQPPPKPQYNEQALGGYYGPPANQITEFYTPSPGWR